MVLILKSMLFKYNQSNEIRKTRQQKLNKAFISMSQWRMRVPYGCDETSGEGAIRETQKKATLSHTCLANSTWTCNLEAQVDKKNPYQYNATLTKQKL